MTITDNTVWDNENILETGTDKGGPACANNVFARNTAYAATSQGRSWGMFLRCALNMVVAHNTFHDVEGFVFSIGYDSANFSGAIDGLRVVDNIISLNGTGAKVFGLTSSLPASVRIDYDLARTSGVYATLADGRSTRDPAQFTQWTGYQSHGISTRTRLRGCGRPRLPSRARAPRPSTPASRSPVSAIRGPARLPTSDATSASRSGAPAHHSVAKSHGQGQDQWGITVPETRRGSGTLTRTGRLAAVVRHRGRMTQTSGREPRSRPSRGDQA